MFSELIYNTRVLYVAVAVFAPFWWIDCAKCRLQQGIVGWLQEDRVPRTVARARGMIYPLQCVRVTLHSEEIWYRCTYNFFLGAGFRAAALKDEKSFLKNSVLQIPLVAANRCARWVRSSHRTWRENAGRVVFYNRKTTDSDHWKIVSVRNFTLIPAPGRFVRCNFLYENTTHLKISKCAFYDLHKTL